MWKLTEDGNALRTDGRVRLFVRKTFEVVYERIHSDSNIFPDESIFGTFDNKDDARRMIADYIAERNGMEETNGQTDSET